MLRAAHAIEPKGAVMRTTAAIALVVAAVAASSLPAAARSGWHDGGCTRVAGEFAFTKFQFTSDTTAFGVGVVRGDLAGTFHAQYWDITPGANGVIDAQGSHVLTTPRGTVVTLDEIRLLPDTNGFVRPDSRLHVVGVTKAFKDTTGLLRTSGRVNLTTLEGAITFEGEICKAGEGEGFVEEA
jgi:hypothetical protein